MGKYKKKYNGTGSIGTSMQGKVEYVRKGPEKGKANCQRCKYFKYDYYCKKYQGVAYYPQQDKKCEYFKEETNE